MFSITVFSRRLLFLNAGSMFFATGTQNLNRMGGLMKFMPLTAITAWWLRCPFPACRCSTASPASGASTLRRFRAAGSAKYLALFAVIAILTSALTLASFIKFFGVASSRVPARWWPTGGPQGPAGSQLDDAVAPGLARAVVRAPGDFAGNRIQPDAARAGRESSLIEFKRHGKALGSDQVGCKAPFLYHSYSLRHRLGVGSQNRGVGAPPQRKLNRRGPVGAAAG